MENILHYIHDPLCGWYYAAEALVDVVRQHSAGRFGIELHAGGLFRRMYLPASMREHIKIADARIGDLTGQVFGQA